MKSDRSTMAPGTYHGTWSGYDVELTSMEPGHAGIMSALGVAKPAPKLPVTLEAASGNRGVAEVEAVVDIGGRIRVWTL